MPSSPGNGSAGTSAPAFEMIRRLAPLSRQARDGACRGARYINGVGLLIEGNSFGIGDLFRQGKAYDLGALCLHRGQRQHDHESRCRDESAHEFFLYMKARPGIRPAFRRHDIMRRAR